MGSASSARSLFLADFEVRELRAAQQVEIRRIIGEPPLCQPKRQFIEACPFGPEGRTFYVREDFQTLGRHIIYRADFSPVEQARMDPWVDAALMKEWHARLSVSLALADVERGGPTGYRWRLILREARYAA